MNFINRYFRFSMILDAFFCAIIFPTLVIGALHAGKTVAASVFAVIGVLLALLYGRYWRRNPYSVSVDTGRGQYILPFIAIGCLINGQFVAAIVFAVLGAAFIAFRAWRLRQA